MARRPRLFAPGLLYHVIARGNQRQPTFLTDADYEAYLARLARYRRRYGVFLYAYCLMPNHVHLLAETSEAPLWRFMQGLQQSYTQRFNRVYGKVSGHRAYLGADRGGLVDAGPILSMLGGRSAYRRFVHGGIGAGQQFLGARGFAQKIGQPTAQLAVEPPKRPLTMALGDLSRRCALDLSVLRSPDRGHAVSRARAALSFVLVRRLGYRVADVAAAFHRDAATISVIVSREARRLESSARRTADASRIHRNV